MSDAIYRRIPCPDCPTTYPCPLCRGARVIYVEVDARELRRDITLLCAEMIRTSKRALWADCDPPSFRAGYAFAQRELADILGLVARGEIDMATAEERHRG